jgi:hypothetical protein
MLFMALAGSIMPKKPSTGLAVAAAYLAVLVAFLPMGSGRVQIQRFDEGLRAMEILVLICECNFQ